MTLIDALQSAFLEMKAMFVKDHNDGLMDMSYAEFSLKCYIAYAEPIYATILKEGAPLSNAFLANGVDTPRDQLLLLINTLYLSLHTNHPIQP